MTPDSGTPGTVVTATASLSLPGPWPLLFLDPAARTAGGECHHGVAIGEGQGISQQGGKYQVTGTGVIPPATPGTAEICYAMSVVRISGSDVFTVVGLA